MKALRLFIPLQYCQQITQHKGIRAVSWLSLTTVLFCSRYYAWTIVTGLQGKRETATKGEFQDKKNSENLDVKKDPNSYQVLSSCSASQTSCSERPVLPPNDSRPTHTIIHMTREHSTTYTPYHMNSTPPKLLEKLLHVYIGLWTWSPHGSVTKESLPVHRSHFE